MRNNPSKIALLAGFVLAMAFTFSCSSGGGGGDSHGGTLKKEKISGVSQKGPFAKGAKVKIYELDASTGKEGNSFEATTDASGNFKIENVTLASPYIVIEVSGKYFNEVSGEQTAAPITLKAVADVSGKDNVNINVFTHLEYSKVLELAKGGKEFGAAKKAAQKEVLNALGISEKGIKSSEDISLFGSSLGDSLLLATSILLQASQIDVSKLLADIINDNGTLSDATKTELASGLANLDMAKVGANIKKQAPSAKVPTLDDINKIVENMEGSSSPSVGSSSSGGNPGSSSSSVGNNGGGGSSSSVGYTEKGNDIANYRTVQIGEQVWMAENLDYNVEGSRCYNNDPANCAKYGRLYDYATAMDIDTEYNSELWGGSDAKHQGICPKGWHIPSNADWNVLMQFVNPSCDDNKKCAGAGTKLKATSGWADYNGKSGNGTDDYDFSALPGGYGTSDGDFNGGSSGHWCSSSEHGSQSTYLRTMDYTYEDVYYFNNGGKSDLFSVRCVKD
jgi:uncharacterized protein (TIGR02145 family)